MERSIEEITKLVLEALSAQANDGYKVPIGVSARHIHLTQEHVEALFGAGYTLTKKEGAYGWSVCG